MASERRERKRKAGQRQSTQVSGMPRTGAGRRRREALNYPHEAVIQWLQTVKFRKTLFGGLDENDVWKKLSELNAMYEAALKAERVRYDTLLEKYTESAGNACADNGTVFSVGQAGQGTTQKGQMPRQKETIWAEQTK